MTELYAIYHKPTGKYMPARMFRVTRNGWTWWEPTGVNGLGGFDPEVPRLFSKKSSAVQAMGYWLNGNHKTVTSGHYEDFEFGIETVSPEIPRRPEDVEIHIISLTKTAIV
jgi:hypothetical protein